MEKLIYILPFLFISYSCTKDKVSTAYEQTFNPPLEATSIDQWLSGPACSFPSNSDSTVYLDLDLNNDQTVDVQFEIRHYQNSLDLSSPTECRVAYQIMLAPFNGWEIATDEVTYSPVYPVHPFTENDIINNHDQWNNDSPNSQAYIRLAGGGLPFNVDITGEYIAVRKNDQYGWIKFESIDNIVRVYSTRIGSSNEEVKAGY